MNTIYNSNPFTSSELHIELSQNTVLTSDITITSNNYFVFGQDGITFDGNNKTITIKDTTSQYPGLFKNGDAVMDGKANITIKNVKIVITNVKVSQKSGTLCQYFFGRNSTNNLVENCSVTGNLTGFKSSGFFGENTGYFHGEVTAKNCSFNGDITAQHSSGIFGQLSGSTSGTVTAKNCYMIGNIFANNSIGIFGNNAGATSGIALAENC